jgi:hypothetical protein
MTDEFAARRRVSQEEAITELRPYVAAFIAEGLDAAPELAEAVTQIYTQTYLNSGGLRKARTAAFIYSMRKMLSHTEPDSDPTTVATWLAVAAINAATVQAAYDAPEPYVVRWTTMHDSQVRHAHADAEGQRRPPGSYFFVGGENLRYPGDPRGRLDNTINCRCIAQPIQLDVSAVTAAAKEKTMLETALPWHGVLAPEGQWSGDGRMFAVDSLRNRDLPLPLTWQKASSDGHDGSVVVGRIDSIERVDGMMRGEGVFVDTPETDEVVGLIAEFGKFGVSVDADDSEFTFDEDTGKVTFTSARIASASLVPIPAFAEAYVALGTWADQAPPMPPVEEVECDPEADDYEDCLAAKEAKDISDGYSLGTTGGVVEMISEGAWDGSASRYTPEQWKKATVLHVCTGDEKSCHKLPIKEPGGALSRAGVHAAAARFNQVDAPPEAKASAARQLRGAYKQLGEEAPDVLKAAGEVDTFGRGPGWLTNPEDTRRIWAYWTQPGHEGYNKINWGVPGDFNRCRVEVGEEIGENSPDKLRFLNQICAQWHHDATGFWPGRAPTELALGHLTPGAESAPSLTLVAAASRKAPASWFTDPHLSGPTHLTVTEEGRVFGHIAEWKTCHIGYDQVCVAPPSSVSGYAYFATGQVLLDDDTSARTGVLSLGGGHASARSGARAAAAHYDSTSSAVADVSVGEDEHGIWCAGWVRPGTDDNVVTALRASDVSGDWREIGGNLELVAALAVNVAGFPIAAVHDRTQVALVASGVVHLEPMIELADMVREAVHEELVRQTRMAKLRERVGV